MLCVKLSYYLKKKKRNPKPGIIEIKKIWSVYNHLRWETWDIRSSKTTSDVTFFFMYLSIHSVHHKTGKQFQFQK